jgi:hypothetical protein
MNLNFSEKSNWTANSFGYKLKREWRLFINACFFKNFNWFVNLNELFGDASTRLSTCRQPILCGQFFPRSGSPYIPSAVLWFFRNSGTLRKWAFDNFSGFRHKPLFWCSLYSFATHSQLIQCRRHLTRVWCFHGFYKHKYCARSPGKSFTEKSIIDVFKFIYGKKVEDQSKYSGFFTQLEG